MSCGALKNWAAKDKCWIKKGYKPGDLIMFNFRGGKDPLHIGICVSVSGNKITTIDGNTSASGSQDNGGIVMQRTRDIKYVVGAVRPAYSSEKPKSEVCTVEVPVLKKGAKNNAVKTLQKLLDADGAKLAVDGSFGSATETALKAWQKKHGLTADGSCGPKTWAEMLGV